jgi:hypothetical protein
MEFLNQCLVESTGAKPKVAGCCCRQRPGGEVDYVIDTRLFSAPPFPNPSVPLASVSVSRSSWSSRQNSPPLPFLASAFSLHPACSSGYFSRSGRLRQRAVRLGRWLARLLNKSLQNQDRGGHDLPSV